MDTICFPNHIGVPGASGPPTLDGLAEPESIFVAPNFGVDESHIDTGWAGASRITYNGSVDASLGTPVMSFQGLKHNSNNEIFLSFVVRRDTGFSEDDAIVIAFNRGVAGKTADSRRIDILPLDNHAGFPASPDAAKYGAAYTVKQQTFPPAGVGVFTVILYDWDPGTSAWVERAGAIPAGLEIVVRTWESASDYNWAVEMRMPTTGWITLDPTFGFYYNVIRNCTAAACTLAPTPFDGFSTQFTFPRGNYFNDPAMLNLRDYEIADTWFGEAQMGACAGFMQGLDFNGTAYTSIGVDDGAGNLTGSIDRNNTNIFKAKVHNTVPAGTPNADVTGVTAEFRIANWGIGPSGPSSYDFSTSKWNKVPEDAGSANPTDPLITLAPGASAELTMDWTLDAAEKAQFGVTLSNHQCVWVRLDAGNGNIVRSSVRRNMNVTPMSAYEAKAQISGVYDDGSGDHDFLLITTAVPIARRVNRDQQKRMMARQAPGGMAEIPTHERPKGWLWQVLNAVTLGLMKRMESVEYRYVWITDGFKLTEGAFNHNGKSYALYTPADSFGVIGAHSGLVENFAQDMQPVPGQQDRLLGQSNDGRFRRINVPDGKATDLNVELEAKEFRPGCLGLIMAALSGKLFEDIP